MKAKFLFPSYFKIIGLILLVPSLILAIASLYYEYELPGFEVENFRTKTDILLPANEDFTNELAGIALLISLVFIGFSRIKEEDEYSMQIRLDSLLWAVYVYCFATFIAILSIYGSAFFLIMLYLMYLPLIVHILIFYFKILRR